MPLPAVWAFAATATTMPAADFCRTVRVNRFTLSPDSGTCDRPPEVSSTAFNAQPPNLQPVPLMDVDFAVLCLLVRHRMPHIRFLSIGSRLCSTLLSDLASRSDPCASLSLLLHQDMKRTYTSKLLNMLGTQSEGAPEERLAMLLSVQCLKWFYAIVAVFSCASHEGYRDTKAGRARLNAVNPIRTEPVRSWARKASVGL